MKPINNVSNLSLLASLFLVGLMIPLLVWGQSDRSVESETEIETESAAVESANYNNTRSNRSSVTASEDINVCDGATCPDGSCVATADLCVASSNDDDSTATASGEHEIEYDVRSGGAAAASSNSDLDADGMPDMLESDTPDPRDPDDDGDGILTADESEAASVQNAPNEASEKESESDMSEPSSGTPDRAQSHNSSRSNRTEGVAVDWIDPDDDGDGIPEVALRSGGFIKLGGVDGDPDHYESRSGEVVCWGRAEDEEGKVYSWGQGLCIALAASTERSATATARISALQVRGDQVRSWSENERAAWSEYRTSRGTTTTSQALAAFVVEEMQTNDKLKEVRVVDDEPSEDVSLQYRPVEIRYSAQMRLFGLIPLEREVMASIDTDGNTTIDYPWYSFLSRKPDTQTIQGLLQSVVGMTSSHSGGGGAGKVSF